ncbi:hypothetical protein AZO1586I_219, partial [Bathymodiolus thermophilus thioautotrophic gill symbiont]
AKQKGLKTSEEFKQEQQQALRDKTDKYLKSLSADEMKKLYKDSYDDSCYFIKIGTKTE